jgi:hypothetical protein
VNLAINSCDSGTPATEVKDGSCCGNPVQRGWK